MKIPSIICFLCFLSSCTYCKIYHNPEGSPMENGRKKEWISFISRRIISSRSCPDEALSSYYLTQEESLEFFKKMKVKNTITWVGHATFLIKINEFYILTDPFFSDVAGVIGIGPKRYFPPGINLEDIPKLDAILCSHDHYDHLDLKSLSQIYKKFGREVQIYCPLGCGKYFEKVGFKKIHEMDWNQTATLYRNELKNRNFEKEVSQELNPEQATILAQEGASESRSSGERRMLSKSDSSDHLGLYKIDIFCFPAVHNSGRSIGTKNKTLWCSFGLKTTGYSIYFSGDTGYHPYIFKECREQLGGCDLALIGIGAYCPENLLGCSHVNPENAVEIANDLQATNIVGMHWGTLNLSDEPVCEPILRFLEAAKQKGFSSERVWPMKIGETRPLPFLFPELVPLKSEF